MKKTILTSLLAVAAATGAANASYGTDGHTTLADAKTAIELIDSNWGVMEGFYSGLAGIDWSQTGNTLLADIELKMKAAVGSTNLDTMGQMVDAVGTSIQGLYTNAVQVNAGLALANSNINQLDSKINDLDKDLSAGVASANAFTGLDNHLDAGKKYSIGVGAGYYNSQGAMAVGGAFRTGDAHAVNAGVSVGSQGQFGAKAGWNIQF
jgi:autotransporter adhesin